jgi:hypothetical protein
MKKSIKAALLSALVLPGAGHFYLQRAGRGAVLATIALLAAGYIANQAVQQALVIVDKIQSGEIPLDVAAIERATQTADSPLATLAWCALAISWLIGVIDAFRIGSAIDARSINPVAQ